MQISGSPEHNLGLVRDKGLRGYPEIRDRGLTCLQESSTQICAISSLGLTPHYARDGRVCTPGGCAISIFLGGGPSLGLSGGTPAMIWHALRTLANAEAASTDVKVRLYKVTGPAVLEFYGSGQLGGVKGET